jgi:hypothetical protein
MDHPPARFHRALILSHPGHELRILGWLAAYRPLVIILTDGTGHGDRPRIELSRKLVDEAGGQASELFGNLTDRQLYQAILTRDLPFFLNLRDQITRVLKGHHIDVVAGDSIEGYNPSHDLCRCLIDVSLFELQKTSRRTVLNYEFPLAGHPAAWSNEANAVCHRLGDGERRWKLGKIRSYANAVGGQLLAEVEETLAKFGEKVLAEEWLTPAQSALSLNRFEETPPYYERYGNQQVASGHYQDLIRYREHLLPITATLGIGQAA